MKAATWLNSRDARAVLLSLLIVLTGIATTPQGRPRALAGWALLLGITALAAHVPAGKITVRSLAVLPFAAVFAGAVVPVQGWGFAGVLLTRAWLSAFAVLLTVEAISAPRLFNALARLGLPQALVVVLQFIYRFLFVLGEVARKMRDAALARGIQRANRRRAFRAAAGILGVLFASAQFRATRIHAAMLARGYRGHIPALMRERLRPADGALVIAAAALVLTIRSH